MPGSSRPTPGYRRTWRDCSRRCWSAASATGAADATRAGVPAPHRAGDEDASVRHRRAILPGGSRRGREGTAGPRLGGTGVAADDAGDPAAGAVYRTRQAAVKAIAAVAGALLLAACGSLPATSSSASSPSPGSSTLQAVVVASELVVGKQQRVPIGITDHNTPVSDATVHVRSFVLNGSTGTFKGESDAPFKGEGLQGAGIYVAHLDFDKAGDWGVEVTASRPNGARTTARLPMNVLTLPVVPGVGQPAPLTRNPTVKDVAD